MRPRTKLQRLSRAVVATLTLTLAPASLAQPTTPPPTQPLLVRTTGGLVLGASAHGIENFLGIPYAKPPIGPLRWAPPQPAKPWTVARSAAAYGSYCPQPHGLRSPTIVVDEDCLFINVQRPAGTRTGAKLPVFVYIHGGGFAFGSSARDGQDLLVRQDGIIGVTMNYRLGALGFLALPGLTAENNDAGDYGILDQQLALRWVRDNIAAFGGDPSRVTIGGESAGGWSVCDHLVAPASRGLFDQAISQSGSCFSRPLARAEADGETYARKLGCTDPATTLACMRGKQVVELLDDQATTYYPTDGNAVLPQAPRAAVMAGNDAQIPELIGSTLDEQRAFTIKSIGWTPAKYTADLRRRFGPNAATVLAAYPPPSASASPQTPAYDLAAVGTDAGITGSDNVEWGIGGCGAAFLRRTLAQQVPVYAYEFAHRDGPGWYPVPNYVWGAAHATDLVYLYPGHDGGQDYAKFTPEEHHLSDEMVRYWGAFVATGRPEVAGQAHWPRFDTTHDILSLTVGRPRLETETAFATAHRCDLWDKLSGDPVRP